MNKSFFGFSRPDQPWSYAALIDRPLAENNANDIYRCDNPGGSTPFVGTIATLPGGATFTYNVTSGTEGVMTPTSTSQLAKLRVYNTTRGTRALILNCDTGTNTVTLTTDVPGDWQVGDAFTVASQTVSGGGFGWMDIEIVAPELMNVSTLLINGVLNSTTSITALRVHPFETWSGSKQQVVIMQVVSAQNNGLYFLNIINNVITLSWAAGPPTFIVLREAGRFP